MPITLNVNGEERTTGRNPLTPLVDVLRDEFFLTGAKPVCREGICGACIVELDGQPVMSCLVPVGAAEGCEIRTAEALSSGGNPSPLQQAMLDHDVVQCGMCFPGMMVTLTSFFAHNPKPSREEIKVALVGNICRCTGYERLIDAALAFVHRNSTKMTPDLSNATMNFPRRDAHDKLQGRTRYTVDLGRPGMLHALLLRSEVASARIIDVDISRARNMPGVRAIAVAEDAPGMHGIGIADHPLFAKAKVRYHGEPLAAIAADTLEQAQAAAAAILVTL